MKKINPGVPVVMVTAYADEKLVWKALKAGIQEVLNKPVDYDKIFDLIEFHKNKVCGGIT